MPHLHATREISTAPARSLPPHHLTQRHGVEAAPQALRAPKRGDAALRAHARAWVDQHSSGRIVSACSRRSNGGGGKER